MKPAAGAGAALLLLLLGSADAAAEAATREQPPRTLAVGARPAPETVPPRTVHDVLAVLDAHPIDGDKLAAARRVLKAPPPSGIGDRELADFHLARARAANELGLVGPQIAEFRRAIELGGGREPHRVWAELSGVEFAGGNFRNALAAKTKALELAPRNAGGFRIAMHAQLSDMFRRLGDFDSAREQAREAEQWLTFVKRSPGWVHYRHNWMASVEDALGRIEFSAGRFTEAEARFRRTLEYREQDLAASAERIRLALPTAPPPIAAENARDAAEAWLATALRGAGKLAEAEVLARRLAYRCIERRGPASLHTGVMLQQLVMVLMEQNRTIEALALIDRVLGNFDKLGVPPTAYPYVNYRRARANALTARQRWPEALAEFDAMRAAVAEDPQLVETLGAPSLGWIRALVAERKLDEAIAMGDRLARQMRAQMGTNAYPAAEALGYYGAALAAAGRDAEALDALREAVGVMTPAVAEETDRSGRRFARLSYVVEGYLRVLARTRGTPLEKDKGLDAAAEAFVVADALRGQSVQQALAASAARAAAGTPELAALVRDEQDARQARDALYGILADLMSRPSEQMLPQVVADMQARAAEADRRQKSLRAQLRERFPDYADLVAPRPATIAQVRAELAPGEALVSVLPTADQTFVWAVPAQGAAAFAATPLTGTEIGRMVDTLRAALDLESFQIESLPAFDGAVAHRLYRELLAPVESGWKGSEHLIVAAGGALSRLPFGVLLDAPPAAPRPGPLYAHYADWAWLGGQVALSHLPAASALTTLRRMKPGAADRLAFAGFGDPEFRRAPGAGPRTAGRTRSAAVPSGLHAQVRRGEDVAWLDYASIAPLPDTREEILSLAAALGAQPQRDVFLGAEASRANVFATDLARRKVVAFATHGLLAGEFPGVDQPALALANPGGGAHGLLTLADILELKLDADWVVLSACNTAGSDGEGAEAVSGLGRGFFYAGSRALLVTHWPVESVSAKKLVVGVFTAMTADPGLTRAEALRRSMLAVMRGRDDGTRLSTAHPIFWAPYALVGDGGR